MTLGMLFKFFTFHNIDETSYAAIFTLVYAPAPWHYIVE